MLTFVLLTKLSADAVKDPNNIEEINRKITDRVKSQCPGVKWVGSYSILGPYDYLDIFEAPDEKIASKVAIIVRSFGHATTETWLATPWEKFLGISKEMMEVVRASR